MKKVCAFVVMLLMMVGTLAQNNSPSIHGQVKDSNGEMVVNATIQLISASDATIVRQTINKNTGFVVGRVNAGKFFLKLSCIGYRDTTYSISIVAKDTIYNAGVLIMKHESENLMEVIVKQTIPPVITKNDTIIYNASAFKTRPNTTVEDLLKKLPGVQVDKDGDVTFQGERIQKIYIDGKEFFVNDPQLATKNLLADMVQKVEAFDEKSEREKLTGIPDQNRGKSLNLRLKADKKKSYFGDIQAGYADQKNTNIKIACNYLNGNEFIMANAGITDAGAERVNNNLKNVYLNYQNQVSKDLRFSLSYSGNNNQHQSWSYNERETFIADSALLQQREGVSATKSSGHVINVETKYKMDSMSNLEVKTGIGIIESGYNTLSEENSKRESGGVVEKVNSAHTDNNSTGKSWRASFDLKYDHRFRKIGRYVGVKVSGNRNSYTGDGSLMSLTRFYNQAGSQTDSLARNNLFNQDSKDFNVEFGISYTEPLGQGQVLDVYYNLKDAGGESTRNTYNYNPLTDKYDDRDSISTNAFENVNGEHKFGIGYNNFKYRKVNYQAGIAMSKGRQQNENKTDNSKDFTQKISNIFPRASLMYTIAKQRTLRVGYEGQTRQPTLYQLQPLPDFTNPLYVRIGNPTLKAEFNNEINLDYRNFNAKKMRSFSARLIYRRTMNRIANVTITNAQGIQQEQYVNMKGDYGINASLNYELPLTKPQKPLEMRYNTSVNLYRDANLVNGQLNKRHAGSVGQRLIINYHIGDRLIATAEGELNINATKYSTNTSAASTFTTQRYNGNVSYEFPWHLVIYTDFNLQYNSGRQYITVQNVTVWNASVMKRIFKHQKGEIKLTIQDILNDKSNIERVIGSNYIETTKTELVRRLVYLSFVYRFRGNKL